MTRLALLLLVVLATAGCASRPSVKSAAWQRYEFLRPQMGVPFRIVAYATNEVQAQTAARAAFQRVETLNRILSDYDPDSEMNLVCHQTPVGQPATVSPELWEMLWRSQELARATDGAFDATVGPLVQLWRRSRRRRELPPPHLLQEARTRVGWQHLQLDPRQRTVTFHRDRMRLDFGGIAKGYASDEALRVLRDHGLTRVLVAASGDAVAGDAPPGHRGWPVEIGLTDLTNGPPSRPIELRHAAIATSGDLFQRLEIDGRRYSHILDPRTGIGLTDHSLVTVLARDGVTADSLATAVSVLGTEPGLRLVDRTPGAAALILRAPDGQVIESQSRRLPRWLNEAPTAP